MQVFTIQFLFLQVRPLKSSDPLCFLLSRDIDIPRVVELFKDTVIPTVERCVFGTFFRDADHP